MKVTNKEAFDIYQKATEQFSYQVSKGQKSSKAAELFVETYKLSSDDKKKFSTKFTRLVESKPHHKSSTSEVDKWKSGIFEVISNKGRPRVSLGDDPCKKIVRSALKDQVMQIEAFADS